MTDRPRLNPGADLSKLKLTPTEGFVLSRIDGRLSYDDICRVSTLDREETLSILRKLRKVQVILGPKDALVPPPAARKAARTNRTPSPDRGSKTPAPTKITPDMLRKAQEKAGAKATDKVAEKTAPGSKPGRPTRTPSPDRAPQTPAPVLVTPEMLRKAHEKAGGKMEEAPKELGSLLERLDDGEPVPPADLIDGHGLPVELKRRIARLHRRLRKLSAHELLGVPADADQATIKRAFAAASKELHPDRYYGKDLGSFREKLAKIFARVTEAVQELEKARKA
jgi:hypothetical protein